MTFRLRLNSFACAAVAALAVTLTPHTANAQAFDFLWGGTDEFGGGRRVVNFSSKYRPGEVIVSFADRRLYLVTKSGQAITYPIAVPKGEARWQGTTFVSNKRVNPSWTPTPEMVSKNPRLPRWVPGGHPMNPLGVRALYLGSSTYRIHGTDAPWTIGQAVSQGCIRMLNEDVLDLYPRVPVGARVLVTWQRFNTSTLSRSEAPSDTQSATASGSSSSGGTFSFFDDEEEPAKRTVSRKTYRSSMQKSAAVE